MDEINDNDGTLVSFPSSLAHQPDPVVYSGFLSCLQTNIESVADDLERLGNIAFSAKENGGGDIDKLISGIDGLAGYYASILRKQTAGINRVVMRLQRMEGGAA